MLWTWHLIKKHLELKGKVPFRRGCNLLKAQQKERGLDLPAKCHARPAPQSCPTTTALSTFSWSRRPAEAWNVLHVKSKRGALSSLVSSALARTLLRNAPAHACAVSTHPVPGSSIPCLDVTDCDRYDTWDFAVWPGRCVAFRTSMEYHSQRKTLTLDEVDLIVQSVRLNLLRFVAAAEPQAYRAR